MFFFLALQCKKEENVAAMEEQRSQSKREMGDKDWLLFEGLFDSYHNGRNLGV